MGSERAAGTTTDGCRGCGQQAQNCGLVASRLLRDKRGSIIVIVIVIVIIVQRGSIVVIRIPPLERDRRIPFF